MDLPKTRRAFGGVLLAVSLGLVSLRASAGPVPPARTRTLGWAMPLSPLSWLGDAVERRARLKLGDGDVRGLLDRYARPALGETPSYRAFSYGVHGPVHGRGWALLNWSPSSCDEAGEPSRPPLGLRELGLVLPLPLGPTAAPRPEVELLPTWLLAAPGPPEPALFETLPEEPCPAWREPRSVTVARFGGETDTFRLLECDGSVAVEALDRLSVLMRPPPLPRPELPLPGEPDPNAERGEWLPGVKMSDPRLVWLLAQLSAAFPYRWIYLISGYRRDAHGSYHRRGRALDLSVMGVANEVLFKVCRKLKNVGCGYYPNGNYVHVDVRPFGSGHPMWIDVAGPGEPSRYVDSWPGVVDSGALTGAGEE